MTTICSIGGVAKRLESLCRKAISEYNLIEDPNVAVALSGGKDSLTLLYLLHQISGRGIPKLNLHAVHVSGEFSCGPAITKGYLEEICQSLGIPFVAAESGLRRNELECYSCSRERRKLLFNKAKELGCTTIAFGHHLDDSVETLLMNLLHKGEFEANLPKVPMIHYGITIIRPLILAFEKDIREFAQQKGFLRITCRCPVGEQSRRKDVKEILESLERVFPYARSNLAIASRKSGLQKALTPS